MKNTLLIVCTLLVSGTMIAQKNRTYLGQKNLLEVNYSFHMTLLTEKQYYERENGYLRRKDLGPQHGLQLALTRNLAGKLSFGLEFDYARTVFDPPQHVEHNELAGNYDYFDIERIKVNQMAFIGKFEFGRREGVFPIGISHQAGGGLLVVGPSQKSGTAFATTNDGTVRELPYELGNAKGFTCFYNLNFRAPVSDRLLINFGLRYNFSTLFANKYINTKSPINEYQMAHSVNEIVSWNLMRIYAGIGYSF